MADPLSGILETTAAERLATGFVFTEGPLWHPEGFSSSPRARRCTRCAWRCRGSRTPGTGCG